MVLQLWFCSFGFWLTLFCLSRLWIIHLVTMSPEGYLLFHTMSLQSERKREMREECLKVDGCLTGRLIQGRQENSCGLVRIVPHLTPYLIHFHLPGPLCHTHTDPQPHRVIIIISEPLFLWSLHFTFTYSLMHAWKAYHRHYCLCVSFPYCPHPYWHVLIRNHKQAIKLYMVPFGIDVHMIQWFCGPVCRYLSD